MVAELRLPNVQVDNIRRFRVRLGETFELHLRGAVGPVRWSADNDEVLEIKDDGGSVAIIKATATGKSLLELKTRTELLPIDIEVFREEATSFVLRSVGPEVVK